MIVTPILSFSGPYRWLSNFWPVLVIFEGHTYPTVENAYQAAKMHPSQRAPLRGCSPAVAKRYGKTHRPGHWDTIKVSIMTQLLAQKFAYGTSLSAKLIETGGALIVEGNTWGDKFWGVCGGEGRNMLGVLIMQRRTILKDAANVIS